VVLREGRPADAPGLREHVRRLLRGSRTPDDVVFVDALPRTPTGKVVRRELVVRLSGADGPPAPMSAHDERSVRSTR
jgi:acyl-coenzyme A synthetase/AMP-(fatty) acid ligase